MLTKKKISKLYEIITIYSVFNSALSSAQFKKIQKKLTLGEFFLNKYVYIKYKGKYVRCGRTFYLWMN